MEKNCTNCIYAVYVNGRYHHCNGDFKITCFYPEPLRWKSKNPLSNNSYTFRGPINLTHLINDCIKDNKVSFITISANSTLFGVSRQINLKSLEKYSNFVKPTRISSRTPFHIFDIPKSKIAYTMNFAKTLPKLIKSDIRKTAKTIYKNKQSGKCSNKPETKVMVF